MGEVGDRVDGVLIGWLIHMAARIVVVPATSLAFQRMDAKFHPVASGSGPMFIFLGWECFALFSLVSGTRLHFFGASLGLGWKDLLVKGWQ